MSEEHVGTEQDRLLKEMYRHLYRAIHTVDLLGTSMQVTLSWCEHDASEEGKSVTSYLKAKLEELDKVRSLMDLEERSLIHLHAGGELTKSMADGYEATVAGYTLFDFEVQE